MLDADAALLAPAAVRMVDLDARLTGVQLPRAHSGERYRSLLLVARLDGEPLGTAVLSVAPSGRVSGNQVARELRSQLDTELRDALSHRGLALPDSLPLTGIPSIASRNGQGPTRRRYVSVVVTTCCNPVALERCLRSIVACDYEEFEVIVVENRPESSATRTRLPEWFPDEVRIRYVEEPLHGLSRARNAGLAVAEGDVVAFTDEDVIVDRAWVRRCAQGFDRGDDVACVTGLILPLQMETDSQLLLEQFTSFGKGFRRQIFRLPDAREQYPLLPFTPGMIGSGANTALRSDVAHEVGGFDVTLGTGTPAAGGEDLELYIRLLCAGQAVAYEPSAIVWHEHPDGKNRLRRQVYRYGVGLGALFTQQLFAGPEPAELLRTVPAGFRYARDPTSRKNASKSAAYPRRLEWLERFGMLLGPGAYLASVLVTARRRMPSRRGARERRHIHYAGRVGLSNGKTVNVLTFKDRKEFAPTTRHVREVVARRRRDRPAAPRHAATSAVHRALVATAIAAC
ncbi:MAG: glycosyltransferase family 2 protein, partial [Actinomycetota bacterium]|nr:glycosyltransferase family 2 protein [Actinomycetota bacterium]